ncbi:RidA family protein [Acetobacter pomorum]|uniref:RidA family protein n=1 Tax=Acetobacter pomorum TaxID=65959 RepID=UPI000AD6ECFF|nr:translation initiation inhibitor YjgF [Acetobacter pomorum]
MEQKRTPHLKHITGGFVLSDITAPHIKGLDMAEQCRAALERGAQLLAEQGHALHDVTHIFCTVADAENFPSCFSVFRQFFPSVSPIMTLMWLKDAPSTQPKIVFELAVQQEEDIAQEEDYAF